MTSPAEAEVAVQNQEASQSESPVPPTGGPETQTALDNLQTDYDANPTPAVDSAPVATDVSADTTQTVAPQPSAVDAPTEVPPPVGPSLADDTHTDLALPHTPAPTDVHRILRRFFQEMDKMRHFTEEEFIKLGNLVKTELSKV